jgi:CheY-like chemotaxis protein
MGSRMPYCSPPMTDRPVLVVEDHADTRNMVQECLDLSGIPSVTATDGRDALDALQRHRPCLILLDLSMPVMDGWRFRLAQRNLPDPELAQTPVMIMTALNDADEHAVRLGAVDVIPKPLDLDRMVEIVRVYCG